MTYNKIRKVKTLELPYESLLYLREEMRRQRTGRPLSDKAKDRIKRHMPKSGFCIVDDGDFGGCDGDPQNAWEERRWTSWSVDTMIEMLDRANLPHGKIGESEVIDVYI